MVDTNSVPDHPAFRDKHPGHLVLEKIMIVLTVLTLVELTISFLLDGGSLTFEVAALLLIVFAFVKATLIAGYFMHIFYEKKPLVVIFIAFAVPILIGLPIALVALTV